MGDFPVKLLKKQSKHMDSKSSKIYCKEQTSIYSPNKQIHLSQAAKRSLQ